MPASVNARLAGIPRGVAISGAGEKLAFTSKGSLEPAVELLDTIRQQLKRSEERTQGLGVSGGDGVAPPG